MKLSQIYLRGLLMGAADIVPGISGGTVAFITGIYERLINSLRSFDLKLWAVWKKQGFIGLYKAVDASFLITLLLGILSSLLLLSHLISWLLASYPLHLNGLFFGLVVGSAVIISREMGGWSLQQVFFILFGAVIATFISHILPSIGSITPLTFFIAGMIAICAMILPGVSGSFLLLTLGLYAPLVEAIKALNLTLIAAFALGAGSGLLAFSHLLGWLFDHFKTATFAVLFGFVIASLKHIWPWQFLTSYKINEQGKMLPLDTQVLLPWKYSQITELPSHQISVLILMLLGLLAVIYLASRSK
ncbi:DUF368 domain-containing protein [Marinospirillum insulare]|uniref:DUF368 domain-containing protein n=1 Tax=Marinospirillum insulare TaxID=217169 RepID=A0ABQ6A0C4_9GAMM|nr:DUF368 domain-containing protein [Marinospirillum insulare]GLR63708.1 DUF368 domain-containing protein [Marinospirillum insulare]